MSLGSDLRMARETKKMSIREVEKKTGISNSYLSQLENDKVKEPSPNILYALSKAYGIPYIDLMKKVGYLVPKESQKSVDGIALSVIEGLDEEEIEKVKSYIRFIRMEKRSRE